MKIKDLREKKDDLKKLLQDLQEKIGKGRFDAASKQLKNVREVREAKKTIARIHTLFAINKSGEKKLKS